MGKESGRPGVGRYAVGGEVYIQYSSSRQMEGYGSGSQKPGCLLGFQEGEYRPTGLSKRKGKKRGGGER